MKSECLAIAPIKTRRGYPRSFATEIDAVERRGGKESLEALVLAGPEVLSEQGARFGSAVGVGERFDDAAHQRRVLLADPDLEPDDAFPPQTAVVGGERFSRCARHDGAGPLWFPDVYLQIAIGGTGCPRK